MRSGILTGLGLLLAGGCAGALAGERVTFSNAEQRPNTPVADPRKAKPGRSYSIENPFENFGRKGSSLDGVTAPPFAPTVSLPEPQLPLTDKERRLLDQRQNWIFRSTDDIQRDQEDAHRVFGVEQFEDNGGGQKSEGGKGKLVEFYERLSKSEQEANDALTDKVRTSIRSNRSPRPGRYPGDAGRGEGPDADGQGGSFVRGDESEGSLAPVRPMGLGGFDSGPGSEFERGFTGGDRMGRDFDTRSANDRPDWLKAALERNDVLGQSAVSAGPLGAGDGLAAGELRGINRILGSSPIGNPLSSLDPVAAYPDPTREAMNPVLGRPLANSMRPALSGPLMQSDAPARSLSLGGPSPLFGPGPALAPQGVLGSAAGIRAPERPAMHSIKMNLDLPRRAF